MIKKSPRITQFFRTVLVTASALASLSSASAAPPNIIYIVGDGMGAPYVSAYRYFSHNTAPLPVANTLFDEMLIGTAQTYPHDDTYVTDSAAAATALASGTKSYNGAIGVDPEHRPLESILERAKARGYTTAMVVTSAVTHATPASFAAHVQSRQSAEAIADQYLDQKINDKPKVDLLLGGGRKFFERADRNLLAEFTQAGYTTLTELSELPKAQGLPLLGLFADDGLAYALGSDHPQRLADMTQAALGLLKGDKPFFMLIEASQIDWCGHANDIACAMAEMDDLHASLVHLKKFIAAHPNTLLVMTADHNTGGLTLGANNEYIWRTDLLQGVRYTAQTLAERLIAAKQNWPKTWLADTGLDLAADERAALTALLKQPDVNTRAAVASEALAIINRRSATGWTTHGHTGEDVLVFAWGQGAEKWRGNMNNTDLAKRLFELLP